MPQTDRVRYSMKPSGQSHRAADVLSVDLLAELDSISGLLPAAAYIIFIEDLTAGQNVHWTRWPTAFRPGYGGRPAIPPPATTPGRRFWPRGSIVPHRFEVEDIEEKRRLVGIDDADLRERVRRLAVGDCVNVTLRAAANSSAGETVTIRITQINECLYLGELAHRPASTALAGLCEGQPVVFSAAHIHSLARAHPGRPH